MENEYIDAADVAKYIRRDLATKFPGQKFTVHTSKYAGGASIDVGWLDGPTPAEVETIISHYEGAGFDGSIDLKYSYQHWRLLDGSIVFGGTSGTEGSQGTVSRIKCDKPHPKAVSVQLMVDFVHTNRQLSLAFYTKLVQTVAEFWGVPVPEVSDEYGYPHLTDHNLRVDNANEWLETLVLREACRTSAYTPPSAEGNLNTGGVNVQYERDWTWITFSDKPAEAARESLKAMGGRFSARRGAWYITTHVDAAAIHEAIGA